MLDKQTRFIAACRMVAQVFGKQQDEWSYACAETGNESLRTAYAYQDETVRITMARSTGALVVNMLAPHSNPVVYLEDDGNSTRFHGEWTMIEEHVLRLAQVALWP